MSVWESLSTLAVQGGPWGLVSLYVVSIMRGWLVPRSQLLREIGYLERESRAKDETIAELREQQAILLGTRSGVGPVP